MLSSLLRVPLLAQHQYRCLSVALPLQKGHSKWQNIKATKGKNDAERAKKISFLLVKAKSAVKSGGFDLKLNSELAKVQAEFLKNSLPMDTLKNFLAKLKEKQETEGAPEKGPSKKK